MNCFDPVQRSCEKISTSACLGTWPLSKKMDGNCVHFSQIHCTDRCTAQQFGCNFLRAGLIVEQGKNDGGVQNDLIHSSLPDPFQGRTLFRRTEFPPMSSVKKLLRNSMRNLVRLNLYGFIAALL